MYGGGEFLTKLLAFFTFPLIAAALSPMAFGAFELIGTVTTLAGMAINCGLNNSVQRYYWDKDTTPEMRPAIVTSGLYAQATLGLIGVGIGLLSLPWVLPLVERAGWPISWVGLVSAVLLMALTQASQYALDVIRLHFTPWRFLALSFATRVASVCLGIVAVVFLRLGMDGLLAAQVLAFVAIMPIAVWMIRRDLRPGAFKWEWLRELVRFGRPFIYSGLAFWLLGSMDRWMLASMSSVEEVGIFSVAFRFAAIVTFVSSAFGQAWSPAAMKVRTDYPEEYRKIYGQVLLVLLFVMLAVGGGVALFAGEFIGLLMPAAYRDSALPVAILSFAVVMQSTQQVTAAGISLEKKTYLFARLTWLTAAVNFALNLFLIPRLGAAGAAWSTLIGYVVLTSGYMYYTQRLHPLEIQWSRLGGLSALGLFIGAVAVVMVRASLDGQVIALKVALAAICLLLGWKLLPMKSVRAHLT